MSLENIKEDVRFWQRLLRLAGYYDGQIDGIRGPKQRRAEELWGIAHANARALRGEFDERTERNLDTCLPQAADLFRAWLAKAIPAAKRMGYTLKVICGTRSYAEQDALYAQGRTKKGPRVTNAKGGRSNHNFGVAIDIGLFTLARGVYITEDATYESLYTVCPPTGAIQWGGHWKSLKDTPHYQFSGFGTSTATLRKRFEA